MHQNVYVIKIQYTTHDDIPLYLEIEEMVYLFETTNGGMDGWAINENQQKTAVIPISKWGNIALIPNVSTKNPHELVRYGVEFIYRANVYSNLMDTKIQIIYIAAKMGISVSMIEEATRGFVTEREYKKLGEFIIDEFPEKII